MTANLIRAKMRAGDAVVVSGVEELYEWEKCNQLGQDIWSPETWSARSISKKRW